jgi:hypothetical protein
MDDELIKRFTNGIREAIYRYSIKKENVFNLDETGINFDMSSTRTIDIIGKKKISISKNYASKARLTVALTISANGGILPYCMSSKVTATLTRVWGQIDCVNLSQIINLIG